MLYKLLFQTGYLVYDKNIYTLLLFLIDEIKVIEVKDKIFSFIISGCNVSDDAVHKDIEILIKAKKFYILDPKDNSIIME